eukprot:5272945-Prymnesium_polylepis.1
MKLRLALSTQKRRACASTSRSIRPRVPGAGGSQRAASALREHARAPEPHSALQTARSQADFEASEMGGPISHEEVANVGIENSETEIG